MRIRTKRDVLCWSAAITVLAVSVPVLTICSIVKHMPLYYLMRLMIPTAGIPLLITVPTSLFGLNLMRILGETIDRVDRLVKYDPLTGVMARAHFIDTVQSIAPRGGCLMLVDADFFKKVNDTHGHAVGDDALKTIATALVRSSGPDALIGRLGGEEFGVFLPPPVSDGSVRSTAAFMCQAVRSAGAIVGGIELDLTISIGVRRMESGEGFQAGFKEADRLLYEAKRLGRDRYVICDRLLNVRPTPDVAEAASVALRRA